MPGIIQLVPEGLQGFLQIKGEAMPSPLLPGLAANLELTQWYLQTNSEFINQAAVPIAIGNTSFGSLVVPPQEWWYVHSFHVEIQGLGGGESINHVRPHITIAPAGIPMVVGAEMVGVAGSASSGVFQLGGAVGIFVPPTSGFGINVQDGTIVAVNAQAALRVTRLPI